MQDFSNLSFGIPNNLPAPDQAENDSAPGQAVGAAGTPTTAGSKNVGGSISGVNASKGAITATGANSLIVDQGVESAMPTGISSDTSLENPENVFMTCSQPNFGMSPQDKYDSLDQIQNHLEEIAPAVGKFTVAVAVLLSNVLALKAARGEGAEGKQGVTADSSSPSAGSSVSKSVSPTGEVTTTLSTESVSSTGDETTSTTTTVSSGTSSESSSSAETAPPPDNAFSFTTLMDEVGVLTNQESATMAQQQTSEIDATQMQAKDQMKQASMLLTGASMMMTMAIVGLTVSMATSAYQMGGIGNASKEADQAEMQSLNEHQDTLSKVSDSSKASMESAIKNNSSTEAPADAQKEARQLRTLAKDEKTPDNIREQAENLANNVDGASTAATYAPGGRLAGEKYEETDSYKRVLVDSEGKATTPQQAVAFYKREAETSHAQLQKSIADYKVALSSRGAFSRKEVSDEDAEGAVRKSWSPEQKSAYDALSKDPDKQEEMLSSQVQAYKARIASIKINPNSSTWNQVYQNKSQQYQIFAGTLQAVSQVFNSAGQMEDQTYQAYAQQDAAAAQVEGATQQAMAQGVQQTQSLAEQIRQEMSAIASDMQQAVGSTKV